jgi:hypothetical protein
MPAVLVSLTDGTADDILRLHTACDPIFLFETETQVILSVGAASCRDICLSDHLISRQDAAPT